MVDLNIVMEGDVFHFDSETRVSAVYHIRATSRGVPMGLPFPKELDLLAKPGDISR